jgi:hypothetical protein
LIASSGELEINVKGHVSNHIKAGNFIGEVEFLQIEESSSLDRTGEDMSIRVRESSEVTYLAWSFDELASFLKQSSNKVNHAIGEPYYR